MTLNRRFDDLMFHSRSSAARRLYTFTQPILIQALVSDPSDDAPEGAATHLYYEVIVAEGLEEEGNEQSAFLVLDVLGVDGRGRAPIRIHPLQPIGVHVARSVIAAAQIRPVTPPAERRSIRDVKGGA